MSPLSMNMKLLFMFVIAMSFYVTPNNCQFFIRYHVHVVNGLSPGKILFVHCKSADNNLGGYNVGNGQEFSWSFKMNFLRRTLYWCRMAPDNQSYADLKVFWDDKHLLDSCGDDHQCIWIAKDDGVYLRNIPKNIDEFQHSWGSIRHHG
ncbi:conserved hypothetical protein [Ricinus communis]|uniref:S-protein homolog n=1 Tax=Ricinus communis TaxID=3988 RepID=B9S576_RICCO|nr:conserved hypothetical protein [Ricinus communis]